jgi:hypothetical protein
MLRNCQSRIGLVALVGVASMAVSGAAFAQGVGNLGQLPFQIFHNSANVWVVTGPNGGPLPVVLNPAGPVWHKDLAPPPGALIQGGATYTLQESLVVAGNLPWADYHEDILTPPGWNWINPSLLVNGLVPAGYSVVNTGPSVSFYFNPIPPGSVVTISKNLVYSGPVPAFFPGIGVNQYPTPEPATLGLAALGGLVTLHRRNWSASRRSVSR